jgi:hypothetical protein
MLMPYGEKALEESAMRADELAADGNHDGVDLAPDWQRRCPAREQDAVPACALNGTDPKRRERAAAPAARALCD